MASTNCVHVDWSTERPIDTEASRFRPMPGKVLVLPNDPEEVTPGGIYKPASSIQRSPCAIIIAVGKGVEGLEPGMTVYVSYWSSASVILDDTEYRLYCEKDVGGFLVRESYDEP